MSKLFEDSDSDDETNFKTNNVFAENYDCWRQKEELNKLKTKYGEAVLNENDSATSSSEDEDEAAAYVTNETEREFFKTLASLKRKDPKIYDNDVKFFSETSKTSVENQKTKEQPMYIKDYERNMLLENSGNFDDSDDENHKPKIVTYTEEQENIKKNLKDALQNINDSDEDEENWGGMFRSRKKTDAELKQEEEDYKKWLKGQKEDINDDIKEDLKPLKDYWNDPNLDESEKFLKDYILNKRFMEHEDKDYVPTYEEIIHDSDEGLSEDEVQVEKQEEFEHKYNYRFEEPDEEFIKRYPRTIESSLRRKDDKRKVKRAEVKERKQKEKQIKMEEIKQMQLLKKKEIEEKIKKLKEITGNAEIAFDDKDIEDDFDPDAYDKKMQNIFNDEYYTGPEGEQKPEFPDIDEELELENWEKYESQENNEDVVNEPHCEDENFNMDCDFDLEATTSKESKSRRKRKRKTKFAEVLSGPKPTFNPDDKTYQEYLDEYYKLECEDIIGDVPCRFKYRKVVPNSFGLTIEEILAANDRELNKWCSLKKAVQYRPEHVEKYDLIAFDKKGRNETLKKKILPSLFKEDEATTSGKCTQKQILEKTKEVGSAMTNTKTNEAQNDNSPSKENRKKRKKKKSNNAINNEVSNETNEQILEKTKEAESAPINTETDKAQNDNSPSKENKKKRKKKKSNNAINNEVANETNDTKTKKKKKKDRNTQLSKTNEDVVASTIKTNENSHKKRKYKSSELTNDSSKKKFPRKDNAQEIDISDARLKAFGVKPKRFKNKIKYGRNKNASLK